MAQIENEKLKMLIEHWNNVWTEGKLNESQSWENLEKKDPQPKWNIWPVDREALNYSKKIRMISPAIISITRAFGRHNFKLGQSKHPWE